MRVHAKAGAAILLAIGLTFSGGVAQASVTAGDSVPRAALAATAHSTALKTLKAGTPRISGSAKVGGVLKASTGTWTKGTSFAYQWYSAGVKISGATKASLTVKAAHVGKRLTVKVTGSKAGYAKATRTSAKTASVASSWALREYGNFAPITRMGYGDDVIKLPKGAKAAVIKASHTGSSNFIISGLDADGEFAALPVNVIGDYSGTTAIGLSEYERGESKYLEIVADGEWKLFISPVADAPSMKSGGSGDGVFLYNTTSLKKVKITHSGSSNFIVSYHRADTWDLLVNEIGRYSGSKTVKAGPGVVEIMADGKWTFTR